MKKCLKKRPTFREKILNKMRFNKRRFNMTLVGTIEEVMARLKFLLAYFGDGVTVEQVERALQ